MSHPAEPLQDAVEAALRAWGPLKDLIGDRIFDLPPTDAEWPHLVIGEVQVLDDSAEGIVGYEAFVPISVWTRPNAQLTAKPAKRIAARTVDALLAGLQVEGFDVVESQHRSTEVTLDPETQTVLAIPTMRLLLEPLD